ncbi:MAG: hypothetical protein KAG66_17060, partial [Methylococcales bacterium]|nr:hypothetical protein [Methylococcales bacterium]
MLRPYETASEWSTMVSLSGYTESSRIIYNLSHQSCAIIAAGLKHNHVDLLRDLDYYFHRDDATHYLNNLSQSQQTIQLAPVDGESPVFTDGRTGVSSLRIAEIIAAATGNTVHHSNVLKKLSNGDQILTEGGYLLNS